MEIVALSAFLFKTNNNQRPKAPKGGRSLTFVNFIKGWQFG